MSADQNRLTAYAAAQRPPLPRSTNDERPPFVAWSMRILSCMFDPNRIPGDLTRLLDEARADFPIAHDRIVLQAVVERCIDEIRAGWTMIDDLQAERQS